jgi:hypothetical protein
VEPKVVIGPEMLAHVHDVGRKKYGYKIKELNFQKGEAAGIKPYSNLKAIILWLLKR